MRNTRGVKKPSRLCEYRVLKRVVYRSSPIQTNLSRGQPTVYYVMEHNSCNASYYFEFNYDTKEFLIEKFPCKMYKPLNYE